MTPLLRFCHQARSRLGDETGGAYVEVQYLVERCLLDLEERPWSRYASVVHQDVELVEGGEDLMHCGAVGDVAGHGSGPAAFIPDLLRPRFPPRLWSG